MAGDERSVEGGGGAPTRRAEGELSAPVSEPGRFTPNPSLARARAARSKHPGEFGAVPRTRVAGWVARPSPRSEAQARASPRRLLRTLRAWQSLTPHPTLSPGRGKCGLDALRPSTNWPGGRRSARRPAGSGGSSEGFPSVVKAPRLSQLGFKRIL